MNARVSELQQSLKGVCVDERDNSGSVKRRRRREGGQATLTDYWGQARDSVRERERIKGKRHSGGTRRY